MTRKANKISTRRIRENREAFRDFLDETNFPCWMGGDDNNRWLFAAMGLTIHLHQRQAYKQGRSTWNIKEQVLG
ncbi:MAG: hypothetical protein QNJ22_09090 [Desulfosarcinaceae bacterium]|nr:hypothetical protein [Desulfosarcinaceae bacterium]